MSKKGSVANRERRYRHLRQKERTRERERERKSTREICAHAYSSR